MSGWIVRPSILAVRGDERAMSGRVGGGVGEEAGRVKGSWGMGRGTARRVGRGGMAKNKQGCRAGPGLGFMALLFMTTGFRYFYWLR